MLVLAGNAVDCWSLPLPAKARDIAEVLGWLDEEPEDGYSYRLDLDVDGSSVSVPVRDEDEAEAVIRKWNREAKSR